VSVAVHLKTQKKHILSFVQRKQCPIMCFYGFLDFYLKQESIKKNLQGQTQFGLDHGYYASKTRS
jgi:hypothetical protein